MVETIQRVLGVQPEILFTDPKPEDVERTYASIEKAKSLIGYEPKTSFEDGVRNFVNWYQAQTEN